MLETAFFNIALMYHNLGKVADCLLQLRNLCFTHNFMLEFSMNIVTLLC